jgi:hypothetical protein
VSPEDAGDNKGVDGEKVSTATAHQQQQRTGIKSTLCNIDDTQLQQTTVQMQNERSSILMPLLETKGVASGSAVKTIQHHEIIADLPPR